MSVLAADQTPVAELPIIDVAGLSSSSKLARQEVASQLRSACLNSGFFYIRDHGIPRGLIEAVFDQAKCLFDQTEAAKNSVAMSRSFCNRGYEPLKTQTLEQGAPPDLKESFYIGLELKPDDPRVVGRRFNRGPNQWPSGMPGFTPTMKAYFAAMLDLSERMMGGIALSLGLDEGHFAAFVQEPLATLRLLHYPPQPVDATPNEKGAGAHTDFGALTLLLQDQVGGLQVRDPHSQRWMHASPLPGTFVVNLGDMIARWTNDMFHSTLHRVVNTSGTERYSVPFFLSGNPDQVIECLPQCYADGSAPKYPVTTVENHLTEMYRQSYGRAS
jgi:isopenicillin N synthase-like dioxygenase